VTFWYGSGSVPLTNGSGCGSGRPKNIWILWIRIRLRIRIRNTCTFKSSFKDKKSYRGHKTVEIKEFSHYFCLMMEGSGGSGGSGPVLVANKSGCGCGRPKTYGSYGSGSGSVSTKMIFRMFYIPNLYKFGFLCLLLLYSKFHRPVSCFRPQSDQF
jgi:hypothetical protein